MMKMASSPAHLLGKPLVSSETATWLGNHFKVSLRQIKPQIDELFVAGINHIFFHGVTYSPQNEAYPGWLFYASTHFGPTSHFWNELPLLTDYISTCQEYLQGSQPDNQILLYFPTHDLWTKLKGDLLVPLDVHKYGRWFEQSSFGETSNWLWDHGYTFDYISDGQLTNLRVNTSKNLYHNDSISYQCILIPPIDFIEENTLQRLNELAAYGARIVFMERLPEQASGLRARIEKNPEFEIIKTDILSHEGVSVTSRPAEDLKEIGIYREWIKEMGLDFIRKKNKAGYLYFITNLSNKFYADSVILAPSYEYVHLIDPLNGSEGHIKTSGSFFLELPPGKSCIVQASISQPSAGIQHYTEYNDTLRFKEPWTVTFTLDHLESLEFKIDSLTSWTAWDNTDLNTFCGKARYASRFKLPKLPCNDHIYRLEIEDIRETAKIRINGYDCGTLWSLPFYLDIPGSVLRMENIIEIEVQNLSANKILEIDKRRPGWKKFYDINFVDIQYKPFDASNWDYAPSGLIGDILLIKNKME